MLVIFLLGFLEHLVCFVVHALCEEVEQDNCNPLVVSVVLRRVLWT